MNAHAGAQPQFSRREFLKSTAALVVGFAVGREAVAQRAPAAHALGKSIDATEVDGFLAIDNDGRVTIYCGKVDLGLGVRIAFRQLAA
jgi:hypothetical protein